MRLTIALFLLTTCYAQESKPYRSCIATAKVQFELNACANDEAVRVDAELNHLYRKLLSKASSQLEATSKIKACENAWIVYRDSYLDAMFPAADKPAQYGSIYPMELALLRAKLTRQQITALNDLRRQYGE